MPRRPHIVIVNPDEWRGDVLGHLGNPAAVTPNLDEVACRDGVSFSSAFCQNPVCIPSRCSFMTGWYPHVRGHRTQHHMLRQGEPMLLGTLKEEGYFVWWGGKNDVVPGQHGFEDYCHIRYRPDRPVRRDLHEWDGWRGEPGSDTYYSFYHGRLPHDPNEGVYYDRDWANVLGAVEFIRNRPKDRPFCLYLALGSPHPPYAVEEPYYSRIDRARIPPRIPAPEGWRGKPSLLRGIHERQGMRDWSEERWTELRATYYGMCSRVDDQFGRLVEALREAGVYGETAVFFFSDHGDFAGDYGLVEKTQNTFEDCLVRVPFLIKPPAWVETKPRISGALVELVDFSATVEAMAGIAPRHEHFGRSLLPVLAGETDIHRDAVFAEGGRLRGETHCMELESKKYQDPSGLYWPRLSLQRGEGPEHTKAAMCRTGEYKYVKRLYESDELYDLRADPGETTNRIDDPALAGVRAALEERLLRFYMETCDVVPLEADRR
ncbi:MAG: sulfatase-like hydrolase/transferase [Patescibacteria group bacterium]